MESKTKLWKYFYLSQRVFAKLSALLSCYTTNKIIAFVILPYPIVLTYKPVPNLTVTHSYPSFPFPGERWCSLWKRSLLVLKTQLLDLFHCQNKINFIENPNNLIKTCHGFINVKTLNVKMKINVKMRITENVKKIIIGLFKK